MDSINLVALVVTSVLAGVILGALIMHRGIRPRSRNEIESELKICNQQLTQYKNQMTDHFSHTETLVTNLASNFKDLQNHLSSSSEHLSNFQAPNTVYTRIIDPDTKTTLKTPGLIPPLDYATKKGKLGTLNESYGLKDDHPARQPSGDVFDDLS